MKLRNGPFYLKSHCVYCVSYLLVLGSILFLAYLMVWFTPFRLVFLFLARKLRGNRVAYATFGNWSVTGKISFC